VKKEKPIVKPSLIFTEDGETIEYYELRRSLTRQKLT